MKLNRIRLVITTSTVVIILILGYFIIWGGDRYTSSTNKISNDFSKCSQNALNTSKQYSSYPDVIIDRSKNYNAIMHTCIGDIKVELYSNNAPKTVNSFVFLSKNNFYNNIIFHRVIKDFVIQAGDPKEDGTGGPGYKYDDEINPINLGISQETIDSNKTAGYKYDDTLKTSKITKYTLAMANAGPNTNGSQFFITLSDQPSLDGKYTPFGKVVGGMDIVDKISNVSTDPSNDKPTVRIYIKSIEIKEN